VVFSAVLVFFVVADESHSVGLALAVALLSAALVFGLVVSARRRATKQLETIDSTGRVEFDAGLDFACLPETWPAMARETLNATASSTPSLPVRLAVADGALLIDKKQGRFSGRRPFHAEVILTDVSEIVAGKAERTFGGSSLTIALRNGQEIRVDLQLAVAQTEALAGRLRQQIPKWNGVMQPTRGIIVESAPPPLRTSPARSARLLLAVLPPFAIAMAGASSGPFAGVTTLVVLLYTVVWLHMTRPPTMHRRLAVGLALSSVAFVIDALATGEAWRFVGTVVCLALTWPLLRLRPPSY
jgi:hypothetical protein